MPSAPLGGLAGVPAESPLLRVGGGGLAEDRQRLAHARVGRARRDRPDALRAVSWRTCGSSPRGPMVATDTARREPLLARPMVWASKGTSGLGRAQRQEAQPRAQAQGRLHPAVGHRGDDAAAHPGHRPDEGREARQVDVDLERLRWAVLRGDHRPERALRCRAAFRPAPGRPATPGGSAPRAISAFSQASQLAPPSRAPRIRSAIPHCGQRVRARSGWRPRTRGSGPTARPRAAPAGRA